MAVHRHRRISRPKRHALQRVEIGRVVAGAGLGDVVQRSNPTTCGGIRRFVVGEDAVSDVEGFTDRPLGVQFEQTGDREGIGHQLLFRIAILAAAIEEPLGRDDDAGAIDVVADFACDVAAAPPDGARQADPNLVDHQVSLLGQPGQWRYQRPKLPQPVGEVVVEGELDMVVSSACALDDLHNDAASLAHSLFILFALITALQIKTIDLILVLERQPSVRIVQRRPGINCFQLYWGSADLHSNFRTKHAAS
ncbi:hypothetical protein VARIO8X_90456 [Burkholderiales bacterium 8X]|nr:hypothetical protein VARIO8X_90456 [Burkholderiales bacterium 8X]